MPSSTHGSERRLETIDAAIRAFARKGYGGSTLADIAEEAGVSQPRISQVFGNKENAFVIAHRRAADEVLELVRAYAQPPMDIAALGQGYARLVERRPEIFMMVFQGIASAYVPAIGEESRRMVAEVVDVVTGAGGSADDARFLLERSYLVFAMMTLDMAGHAQGDPQILGMLAAMSSLG
ncbi:MAG: TetR/AcrR family transcriptional regulator [Propionibacteriaceae bacterium]|nr:TetR/AcrR family transcriptional regulator [Propionibacteriaceae bacterium]